MAGGAIKDELRRQVIAGLDVISEYKKMGLQLKGEKPRASGKMEAYSMTRQESKASAWIDVNTGLYGDSVAQKDGQKPLSIFDFAVNHGGHANFESAFKYFASQAGVELPKRKSKKGPENPYEKLDFTEWNDGNNTLATFWCIKHKPGSSIEALKAAGARIAYYPCWLKDGEKQRGKNKVIALPCYGSQLTNEPPVAWVLYAINGQKLEVFRGKDVPPDLVKMKSCGPTAGTLMNESAVKRLADDREGIDLIWKSAGPSDMLAIMAAIPEELRASHLVTCNAGGEDADVAHWNAEALAGLKVNIIHDADSTGELGAIKWKQQLSIGTSELRHVRLPYEIATKGGLDVRHYLTVDRKPIAERCLELLNSLRTHYAHDTLAPATL